MDFDEIMKQAGEMKQKQMRDKRREWEATAEFIKNTIAYDKDETYLRLRASGSARERIAHAEPAKAAGNSFYAEGKYSKALDKYTEAAAVFRYWVRSMHGKEQNLTGYKDDVDMEGGDAVDARRFLVSVYLNAAACLLKKNTRNSPGETVWTCTEVLDMDDACVKAYYRRAMAYVQMDSSATLELAVKDLTRASRLAPGDRDVRAALQKHRVAYEAQNAKDKKTYGGMFASSDGLYTRNEREEMRKPAPAPRDPLAGVSDEEFKARARAAGIDLDNPKVRREMEGRARARHDETMRAKAREMRIDLDDPEVRRALEMLEEERRLRAESDGDATVVMPAWRRWMLRAFDKDRMVNVQNVMYAFIAVSILQHSLLGNLSDGFYGVCMLTFRVPFPPQVNVALRVYSVVREVAPGSSRFDPFADDGFDEF